VKVVLVISTFLTFKNERVFFNASFVEISQFLKYEYS